MKNIKTQIVCKQQQMSASPLNPKRCILSTNMSTASDLGAICACGDPSYGAIDTFGDPSCGVIGMFGALVAFSDSSITSFLEV